MSPSNLLFPLGPDPTCHLLATRSCCDLSAYDLPAQPVAPTCLAAAPSSSLSNLPQHGTGLLAPSLPPAPPPSTPDPSAALTRGTMGPPLAHTRTSPLNSSPASLSPMNSPLIGLTHRTKSPTNNPIASIEPTFDVEATPQQVQLLLQRVQLQAAQDEFNLISQKLDAFQAAWPSLHSDVKILVQKLVFCVQESKLELAMKCFVRISVEHTETLSWAIVFKRLIRQLESSETT